jgi:hypothetical protein
MFSAAGDPLPGDGRLRAFVTANQDLVLASGVFEDVNVRKWLEQVPYSEPEAPVTIGCSGVVLGSMSSAWVRLGDRAEFRLEKGVRVASFQRCEMSALHAAN